MRNETDRTLFILQNIFVWVGFLFLRRVKQVDMKTEYVA